MNDASHLGEGLGRGQENVLRFEVTVSDVFEVQVTQGLKDLPEKSLIHSCKQQIHQQCSF